MLVEEPSDNGTSKQRVPAAQGSRTKYAILTLATIAVLVMRHDYWFWNTTDPLLFDCLPVGLWWQALVSLTACALMWLMVRWAWPGHLEDDVLAGEQQQTIGDGRTNG